MAKNEINHENKKVTGIRKSIKKLGSQISNDINPLIVKPHDRNIKILCIGIGMIFLYSLYTDFNLLVFMLSDKQAVWTFYIILYFLPLIYLPITIYFFFKKSKAGWILLSVWLTYTILTIIHSFIVETYYIEYSNDGILSLIDDLYPRKGLPIYLVSILLYGLVTYYINTKPVKSIFNISKNRQILSVIYTIIATLIIWKYLI